MRLIGFHVFEGGGLINVERNCTVEWNKLHNQTTLSGSLPLLPVNIEPSYNVSWRKWNAWIWGNGRRNCGWIKGCMAVLHHIHTRWGWLSYPDFMESEWFLAMGQQFNIMRTLLCCIPKRDSLICVSGLISFWVTHRQHDVQKDTSHGHRMWLSNTSHCGNIQAQVNCGLHVGLPLRRLLLTRYTWNRSFSCLCPMVKHLLGGLINVERNCTVEWNKLHNQTTLSGSLPFLPVTKLKGCPK